MTSRIDIISQNGNTGSHYLEVSMDRSQEVEALSIVCDALANSCDSDEVSLEGLSGVLCCMKRVTNVLDLDWDDIQTCSFKLNENINEAKEKEVDGK